MNLRNNSKSGEVQANERFGYAICTTGRSGSTWFGALLASTGVLGRPAEFFNTAYQRVREGPDYPAGRRMQKQLILTEGATDNGVYGLKVFPSHLREALDRIRWSDLPNLRFISWTRRDILGQAISRYRAMRSRQWRSSDSAGHDALPFDGEAIANAMQWTVVQSARWELFFARNGLTPLRLVYEDAMKDPQASVDAVARLLGIAAPVPIDAGRVALAIQRDELTESWRSRFLDEFGDIDTMDLLDLPQIQRPR